MDLKPIFVFPRWSNTVTLSLLIFLTIFPAYTGALVVYALDPVTLNVGYAPTQPVPYSHALHAGAQLGIDCRYCHNTVEKADFAALPPAETCMNCHRALWTNSEKLKPIRDAYLNGTPIKWKKVNDVPDYVYFNHAAHVNASISCVECHGNVNQMEVVAQVKPMNMAWCLQCHRDPDPHIRPRDEVTDLDWLKWNAGDASGNGTNASVMLAHQSTIDVVAKMPDEELIARATEAGVLNGSGKAAFTQPGDHLTAESKNFLAGEYVWKMQQASPDELKRQIGEILRKDYHVNPSTDCITCHR